jgi:GDP-4-dehydro-6-deoxy-D-mannose reductase
VLGTQTVLNIIRHLPRPPVVVIAGSASEYGLIEDMDGADELAPLRPLSDYGVSKAAQSLLGQAYALRGEVPVVIGRVFNITGPGEPTSMLCGALAAQIAACEAEAQAPILRVGNLSPVRDYLDVRDAARALWLLTLHGKPGAVYNICSGQPQRVEDVVRQLVALSWKKISIVADPDRQRPSDVPQCVGDPGRLKRETGWSAETPLADSLQATLEWWRAEHARTTTLAA